MPTTDGTSLPLLQMYEAKDRNSRVYFYSRMTEQWMGLRVDLLGCVVVAAASTFAVLGKHYNFAFLVRATRGPSTAPTRGLRLRSMFWVLSMSVRKCVRAGHSTRAGVLGPGVCDGPQ